MTRNYLSPSAILPAPPDPLSSHGRAGRPNVFARLSVVRAGAILCASAIFFPTQAYTQDPEWEASVGARYVSRVTAYGVDLSESPSLGFSTAVLHRSGVQFEAGAVRTLGSAGEFQHWSLGIGYETIVSDLLTLNASFTHYNYSSDSANVLASLSNELSIGADLSLGSASVGLSYDTYLGTAGASFVSVDVSSFYQAGPLFVVPLVQLTFVSQDVENRLLKNGKKNSTGTSTVTSVTGLSSFSLHAVIVAPVISDVTFTFHPYYLYSPQSEISASASRFVWSVGLSYGVEW